MVRIMTFSHNTTSSMLLFHKLNLLTLNDVFKLEIAEVIHNIENNEHLPIKASMYYGKLEQKRGKLNSLLGSKFLARSSTRFKIKPFAAVLKKCVNYLISQYTNR